MSIQETQLQHTEKPHVEIDHNGNDISAVSPPVGSRHGGIVDHVSGHDQVAPEVIGGDLSDMPKGYYWRPAFVGTFTATALAQVSGYVGWSLPANTLLLINADIGPSPNVIWVSLAWTLSLSVGYALVGRMSDIWGRRYFFIATTFLALVGTIVAATAKNINTLIGANVLIGIGAAGQLSFPIILGELVPNRMRGPANGLIFVSSAPIAVFGPIIARSFIENLTQKWRWNYYLGLILNGVALILFLVFYHPPTYDQLHLNGKSKRRQVMEFDWVGVFLLTAGLVLFLIGLNWGGGVYPWTSAHVLAPLLVGVVVIAAFCCWEAFGPTVTPLIPMRVFKNGNYDAILACACVGAMVSYSTSIIWPMAISSLYTTDVQYAGWLACMTGGGLSVGQIAGGLGLRYAPRMKIQMILCAILLTSFVVGLASMNASSLDRTLAFLFLGTVAAGYIETLALSAVSLVWDADDIGLVNGVLGCLRTIAASVVISMLSALLTNQSEKYVPKYVTPAAIGAGLPSSSLVALFQALSTGNLDSVPGISAAIKLAVGQATQAAYAKTFEICYLSMLPFGVCTLISSFFVPNMEDYLTTEVARRLQGGIVFTKKQVDEEN